VRARSSSSAFGPRLRACVTPCAARVLWKNYRLLLPEDTYRTRWNRLLLVLVLAQGRQIASYAVVHEASSKLCSPLDAHGHGHATWAHVFIMAIGLRVGLGATTRTVRMMYDIYGYSTLLAHSTCHAAASDEYIYIPYGNNAAI